MNFTVLTIFPEMFSMFRDNGIIRRAIERQIISVSAVDIRSYTTDRHRTTDDRPFGGGCGMVMKPEPLAAAIREAKTRNPSSKTVLMTPQGQRFDQSLASALAPEEGIIFVCGRYEGIDERICQDFIDDEISIGDYVLTGGELPAMLVMDAVTRLLPGALGGEDSAEKDSFATGLLEHGHYTRPRVFEGEAVPDVLLSGNHKAIEEWRLEMSLIRTFLKRPDLLESHPVSRQEMDILKKWCATIEKFTKRKPVCGPDSSSGAE